MHHLPFTLAAYFFNSVAVLIDKYLLSDKISHPLVYIFYISIFSLIVLVFLPFTHIPTVEVFLLASFSTILWTLGAYFLYKALQVGSASRVVPVIGTMIPLLLVIHAAMTKSITQTEINAVFILTGGMFFLTVTDWRGKIGKHEVLFEFYSAFLFAISYLLLHQAYLKEHFLTVLVWSRFVLIPVGITLFLWPHSRGIIFGSKKTKPTFHLFSANGVLFLFGQFSGGISELLITYSVSLANPALVNSLQGSQYIFLYIASLFLGKKMPHIFSENYKGVAFYLKTIGIICLAVGLYFLAFARGH